MAIINIGVGNSPNDGTGDALRDAFIKCNSNFTALDTQTNPDFLDVLNNGNDASTSAFTIGNIFVKDDIQLGVINVFASDKTLFFFDQDGEATLNVSWLGFEMGSAIFASSGTNFLVVNRPRLLVNNASMTENLGVVGTAKITDRLSIGANGSSDYMFEIKDDDATQYSSSSSSVTSPVSTNSIAINLQNGDNGNLKATFIKFTNQNASSISQTAYIGGVGVSGSSQFSNSIVFGFRTGASSYSEFMRLSSSGFVIGNTAMASTSTIFQVDSTTKGVILPRMTTTQVNAISPVIAGMLVYNTTLNHLCFYDGSGWRKFSFSNM